VIELPIEACLGRHGKLSANMVRAFATAAVLAGMITGGTANADATLDHAPYGTTQGGQAVDAEEAAEWREAVAPAKAAGTFFLASPHHCAVGTKPA